MATPAPIGALPAVPSAAVGIPSGLAQFGSALADAPDAARKEQLERMQQDVQRQEMGQKLLSTLAQRLSSDPNAQNDPNFARQADMITRESGLPSVTQRGPNGETVNRDALIPRKFLRDLDPKALMDLRGLDPTTRAEQAQAMGIDVNDPEAKGFLSAQADVSLNPAMVTAAQRNSIGVVEQWQKGLMDPSAYAASIKSMSKALGPDATAALTDPSMISQGISAYAQAKITAIPLEVQAKLDMAKVRTRLESDAQSRFEQNMGLRQDEFAERKKMDAANLPRIEAATRSANASALRSGVEAQNAGRILDLRTQLLQVEIAKGQNANRSSMANVANQSTRLLLDAQGKLDTLDNNIANQIDSNDADPNSPAVQQLMGQRQALQASIDQLGAAISQAPTQSQALGGTVSGVLGRPTANVTPGGDGGPANVGSPKGVIPRQKLEDYAAQMGTTYAQERAKALAAGYGVGP